MYNPVAVREPGEPSGVALYKSNKLWKGTLGVFLVLASLTYVWYWLIDNSLHSHHKDTATTVVEDVSQFQLKLQGNLSEVANETILAEEIQYAIANQLNIPPDQVIILSLTPGSIVVDVKIIGFPKPELPFINVTTIDNITVLEPDANATLPIYPTASQLAQWFLLRITNHTDPLHNETVFKQYPIILPPTPTLPKPPLNLTVVYEELQRDYVTLYALQQMKLANRTYVDTSQQTMMGYVNATKQNLQNSIDLLKQYTNALVLDTQQFVLDKHYTNFSDVQAMITSSETLLTKFVLNKQYANITQLDQAIQQLQQSVSDSDFANHAELNQVYTFIINKQYANLSELAAAVATLYQFITDSQFSTVSQLVNSINQLQQWIMQQQYANTTITTQLRSDLTTLQTNLPTGYVPRSEIETNYATRNYITSLNLVDHPFLDMALAMHPSMDYLTANYPTNVWIQENLHNATILLVQELYVNRTTGQVISHDDGLYYEVYSTGYAHTWGASHNMNLMKLHSNGKLDVSNSVQIADQLLLKFDAIEGIQLIDLTTNTTWLTQKNRVVGSVYTKNGVALDDGNANIRTPGTVTANNGFVSNADSIFNGAVSVNSALTAATVDAGDSTHVNQLGNTMLKPNSQWFSYYAGGMYLDDHFDLYFQGGASSDSNTWYIRSSTGNPVLAVTAITGHVTIGQQNGNFVQQGTGIFTTGSGTNTFNGAAIFTAGATVSEPSSGAPLVVNTGNTGIVNVVLKSNNIVKSYLGWETGSGVFIKNGNGNKILYQGDSASSALSVRTANVVIDNGDGNFYTNGTVTANNGFISNAAATFNAAVNFNGAVTATTIDAGDFNHDNTLGTTMLKPNSRWFSYYAGGMYLDDHFDLNFQGGASSDSYTWNIRKSTGDALLTMTAVTGHVTIGQQNGNFIQQGSGSFTTGSGANTFYGQATFNQAVTAPTLALYTPATGHPAVLILKSNVDAYGGALNGPRIEFNTYYTGNTGTYPQAAIQSIDENILLQGSGSGGLSFRVRNNAVETEALRLSSNLRVATVNNILDSGTGDAVFNGNVGIGVDPAYKLHVSSSDNANITTIANFISPASPSGLSSTRILLVKGSTAYGGFIEGFINQGVGAGLQLGNINSGIATVSLTLGFGQTATFAGDTIMQRMVYMNNQVKRKVIVLYDTYAASANQDRNDYYGFGLSGGTLRYNVEGQSDSHVFYSASGSGIDDATELFRIQGDGSVIGPAPVRRTETIAAAGALSTILDSYIDTTSGSFTVTLGPASSSGQTKLISLLTRRGANAIVQCDRGTFQLTASTPRKQLRYDSNYGWMIEPMCDTCPDSFYVTRQQGSKLVGTGYVTNPQLGPTALSADGNTMVVGGPFDDAVWVFTRTGSAWTQQGSKLTGTDETGGAAGQGFSVAISADGNTIAIGGPYDDSNNGAVWIMTRSGTTWTQQGSKLVGVGNTGAASQGSSVALSADGNTLAVGGPGDNSNNGATWIFTRSGTTWSQQAMLVGTANVGAARQGASVSLSADGNIVAFGGPADDSNKGAVWSFARVGTSWSFGFTRMTGASQVGAASYGTSVSLSADGMSLVIGGPNDNSGAGAIWIKGRQSTVLGTSAWTGTTKRLGPNAAGALFGSAVAFSGDGSVLYGTVPGYSSSTGALWAYVKDQNGNYWASGVYTGTDITTGGTPITGSGQSGAASMGYSNQIGISANGNTVAVGGYADNSNVGAVWVFV